VSVTSFYIYPYSIIMVKDRKKSSLYEFIILYSFRVVNWYNRH